MWLNKMIFYLANNKIAKKNNPMTYDNINQDLSLTYAINLDDDVICIDIDDNNSRLLLNKAKDDGMLDELVYSYKPNSNSFHFYFKKDSRCTGLKNKNCYLSINNIVYEVLTKQAIIFHPDNVYSNNFFTISQLPSLDVIFLPAKNVNDNWELFSGCGNRTMALLNAKEGDKRSQNSFVITSNIKKRYDINDFERFYTFNNNYILSDPLKNSEINNNIKQLNSANNTVIDNDYSFLNFSNIKNKEVVSINDLLFCEYLVNKYHIITYNSITYLYYDNRYITYNKEYKKISNILYYLIKLEFKQLLKEYEGLDKKYLTIAKYNELESHILNNAIYINNNDTNSNNIKLKNGVLVYDSNSNDYNLECGNVLSDYLIFSDIDIEYNPNIITNSKIDSWLNSLFYRKNDINEQNALISCFWEMLGCCLVDNSNNRSAFIFKGKGKNGKSTMLQFIIRFLGNKNTTSLSYDQLSGEESPFTTSALRNKKANLTDEMPSVFDANNGILKTLISGGTINSDVKFKEMISWKNFATLIFATNYNINVIKFNQAISDRLCIFELKNKFDGISEIKNYEQHLLKNKEDYQYVLNKAIAGLLRLIKNKYQFTFTKDNFNNKLNMILDNEPVKNWFYDTNKLKPFDNKLEFIIRDDFFNHCDVITLKDYFNDFKDWYKDYYGKDCGYGIALFKAKLNELNLTTKRVDNKEYLVRDNI